MQKSLGLGFFIMFFLCINSCNNAQQQSEHTNRLIHESSPYLLQHAHNPVDWYPWGTDAFAKAKKENKPVIISIGYAACHWCHVMEHESFEDDSVANFMNKNFICIKVDREERPDIDQIYIDAAQMMTGSAGWPLNCIALPDGKPFFAGTYFPKDQWIDLLDKVNELWNNDQERIVQMAAEVTKGISGNTVIQVSEKDEIDHSILEPATRNWLKMFDKKEGGYNRVPKFPMPSDIDALLTLYKLTYNQEALEFANLTMRKMANGGIYDQVGGGFARYSTDGFWKVPHFEKMLYDNGQLLSLYAKGYMVSKDPLFKQIVDETIRFMEREILSDYGGFYSSLDADSEGEEGLFYVWTKDELDEALGSDTELVNAYYQVTASGNWEHGKNILIPMEDKTKLLAKFDLNPEELQKIIKRAKEMLLEKRVVRIRPGLDTKILTSWNGLAISGLVDAYKAFSNKRYLQLALATGNFLSEKMMKDDFRLDRNFNNGKSSINGFLDDYAFTISAYIDLYKVTFDEAWLNMAMSLTQYVLAHFSDDTSSYFYYTSDLDPQLITRKIETYDNVIPSANSEMAMNLFFLGNYFYDEEFLKKSNRMLNGMSSYFEEHASGFANWFHLYLLKTHEFYEVAIVGNDYSKLKEKMEAQFLPNAILMGGAQEGSLELVQNKLVNGETNIYVCKEKMCKLPVSDVQLALDQMNP